MVNVVRVIGDQVSANIPLGVISASTAANTKFNLNINPRWLSLSLQFDYYRIRAVRLTVQ